MKNFSKHRIGGNVIITSGYPFESERFSNEGGIPLIRIRDLQASSTAINYIGKYSDLYVVNPGDILIGMDGDFLITKWRGENALLNQRVLRLRKSENDVIDIGFLYYWLQPFLLQLNNQTTGTTVKHLSINSLTNAIIEAPDFPEQHRIAEILTKVDDDITLTDALIQKYQHIKQGLMQDLLTKGIDENSNIRKISDKNHFKQSVLGLLPENWDVVPMGKFVISSSFGPRFSSNLYANEGSIALVRTTDLDQDGNINYSTLPLVKSDSAFFKNHFLEINDLMISRSGTIGIASVFEGHSYPTIPGAFLIRFRFKPTLKSQYIRRYFNWGVGRKRIINEAAGGVQQNVTGTALLKLLIPIPPLYEQEKIIAILSNTDRVIEIERIYLAKLTRLKRGLMQDLLTENVLIN
jgi:type I restriction enzyme S subunit